MYKSKQDSTMHNISAGCLLIDTNKWGNFIGIFDNSSQKNNTISVTLSRTLASPTNQTIVQQPVFNFILNGRFSDYFNVFGR